MNNSEMKPYRFKRWHDARRKARFIFDAVKAGKTVYLSTYTKVTKITEKQLPLVYATKSGLIIQHGKDQICYDYSKITAQ